MRGWEVIEHTADLGLHVWAPDLPGLFAEGAVAIVRVMGEAAGPVEHTEQMDVEAPDVVALFVDWLSEVLFLFEARGLVPREVRVEVSEGAWRVTGELAGPDAARLLETGPQVKAVTYHRASVERTDHGWEARVYLDV